MLTELIADDDQLEIFVPLVIGELALQNCKSFDQPVKVFVRPDFAGVQDVGVFQLISFQHMPSFFRRMVECETFIQGIVDDGDLRLRNIVDVQKILFCRVRDRQHVL